MRVYLDADILVSLLSPDANTPRAQAAVGKRLPQVVVSDFGGAEFASAISRRVRMREIPAAEGRSILSDYDRWIAATAEVERILPTDVALCASYLRRLDLPVRTPDALHIALASRLGAAILSLDKQLLSSAAKLGVSTL